LQSETQEELPPLLRFGDASRDALLPSVPGAGTKLDMHTLFLKIPEEIY